MADNRRITGPSGAAFTGVMPPPATSPKGPPVASGVERVPSLGAVVPASPSNAMVGVCEWRWDRALPVVVQLSAGILGPDAAGPFPPAAPVQGDAGVTDNSGANQLAATGAFLAAVIDYGAGSSSSRLYCDWRPGAINLPPCEFVRVSAMPWGGGWGANVQQVQASVTVGDLQGAHVPACTGADAWTAGETKTYRVPANARALCVEALTPSDAPIIGVAGDAFGHFDYAANAFTPASLVMDLVGYTFVYVTASVATGLNIQWLLQP